MIPSKLCYADKLALALEPWWLYLPRVMLTGEIKEYMAGCDGKYKGEVRNTGGRRRWFNSVKVFCRSYAYKSVRRKHGI